MDVTGGEGEAACAQGHAYSRAFTHARRGHAESVAVAVPSGGLSGVLYYSKTDQGKNRWEMWQYNLATGENKFLKEWRTEVAISPDYTQLVYFAWPEVVGDKPGIYAANPDMSGERLVIQGGAYPSFSPGGDRLSAQGGGDMYILNSDGRAWQAGHRRIPGLEPDRQLDRTAAAMGRTAACGSRTPIAASAGG